MGGHRLLCRVGAAVAAVTLAGCAAGTVSGHGSAVAAPSTSSSADFPTVTPTEPPSPPPSTAVPTTSAASALATKDISDVRYRIPRGFVKSRLYHPVTPLERHWLARYLVPRNAPAGLDVISILYYRLPPGVPLETIALQKLRVLLYDRLARARVTAGPRVTTIDGWPAIQENAVEQNRYHYAAWFVFSRRHLVQVSCQVDAQVNTIARGCQALLTSMTLR